jgi:hypothetical protein
VSGNSSSDKISQKITREEKKMADLVRFITTHDFRDLPEGVNPNAITPILLNGIWAPNIQERILPTVFFLFSQGFGTIEDIVRVYSMVDPKVLDFIGERNPYDMFVEASRQGQLTLIDFLASRFQIPEEVLFKALEVAIVAPGEHPAYTQLVESLYEAVVRKLFILGAPLRIGARSSLELALLVKNPFMAHTLAELGAS